MGEGKLKMTVVFKSRGLWQQVERVARPTPVTTLQCAMQQDGVMPKAKIWNDLRSLNNVSIGFSATRGVESTSINKAGSARTR